MRILMLDNEFPPLGGGMGTANHAVMQRLARLPDIEVDLVTAALGRVAEQEPFAPRMMIYKVPVDNRNIHHSTNRELLAYAAQALPLANKLHQERRYDGCLAWSAVPAGGVAWALNRMTGLPYSVWVSGPDIPGFEQRYRNLYPVLKPTLRAIWRGATPVIAKCADEITMIQRVDRAVRPVYIPNGVDLSHFRPGAPIADDGPLRVVCVGRLIERKGQHHLIAAIRRLKDLGLDVRAALVGTGDSEAAYRKQAQELQVSDRVEFVGYVAREEIPAAYAAAHVFALPSFNEGMSVALLEAMACGLAPVVTRTGGTAELVDEGTNGLVFDWGDVTALTRHLAALARDRELARRMGAAARHRAARFSWDIVTAQFLGVLRRLGAPELAV